MSDILMLGVRGGKTAFQELCVSWVRHVRAGDEYQDYKHVETQIIKDSEKFGLNPDEVFANLNSFANSGEEIEVV